MIALLANGPSLPRCWHGGRYREVIGTNTSGWHYELDWLAFSDWHIIRRVVTEGRLPLVGCICKEGMRPDRGQWLELSGAFPQLGLPPEKRTGYTFPNALAWAQVRARVYGDIVRIFGFDCSPSKEDFAGQWGEHRAQRWLEELWWVRAAWGPNIEVVSDLHPVLLEWLCGAPGDLPDALIEAGLMPPHGRPPIS